MLSHSLRLSRYSSLDKQARARSPSQAASYWLFQIPKAQQFSLRLSLSWSVNRHFASDSHNIQSDQQPLLGDLSTKQRVYISKSPNLELARHNLQELSSTSQWPHLSVEQNSRSRNGNGAGEETLAQTDSEQSEACQDGRTSLLQRKHLGSRGPSSSSKTIQDQRSRTWAPTRLRGRRISPDCRLEQVIVTELSKQSLRQRRNGLRSRIFVYRSRNHISKVRDHNNIYTSSPRVMHISLRRRLSEEASQKDQSYLRLDIFHPTWSTAFARINAPYRQQYLATKAKLPAFVFHFKRFIPEYDILSLEGKVEGSISKAWGARSFRGKRAWWQHALLFALCKSLPDAMLIARDILHRKSLAIPSYVISDVLDHVAAVTLGSTKRTANLDRFLRAAHAYLDAYSGSASLSQRSLWLLSRWCSVDQLTSLIQRLDASNAPVTTYSKVKMMHRFVSLDSLGLAIELLETIPEKDISSEGVQSICVLILRTEWEVENLYKLRTRLLSHMLELGIRPNRRMHDAILLNAMEAGDRETAWKSFQITLDNGLKPTAFTYSMLLKGVEHGDDLSTVDYIYQGSRREGILFNSPHLAAHLVYSIHIFNKANYKQSFDDMLALFRELFDPTPFQELGILDQSHGSEPLSGGPMRAPVQALGCMILAWLEENQANTSKVQQVYEQFLHNIRARHPRIAALTETTIVFNGFLKAFGSHQHSLNLCTNVVQDMLKLSVSDVSSNDHATSGSVPGDISHGDSSILPVEQSLLISTYATTPPPRTIKLFQSVPPDVISWSIMLDAFMRHQQANAAEKILRVMEIRGVKPDPVTWKNLVSGYVFMQRPEEVVDAVQRMEKDRFKPDDWTMRMLSLVEDRESLLKGFERAVRGRAEEERRERERLEEEREKILREREGWVEEVGRSNSS